MFQSFQLERAPICNVDMQCRCNSQYAICNEDARERGANHGSLPATLLPRVSGEFINRECSLSGEFFDRECNSLSRRESRVSGDARLSGEWQQRRRTHQLKPHRNYIFVKCNINVSQTHFTIIRTSKEPLKTLFPFKSVCK